ncbi:hypothetical protein CE143_14170 [Photorhabdus luminescens]|uniref:Uncharacterized protein n=1 Tax=Photorhabdus akhurstii TaxID=171438 RepID=A0ABX8M1A2_9GAMM|nr:hypothetical protein KS18_00250 [Photorhabdus luminescens]MBS9427800.1 hypothetical protein [Photorhabdus akhurstii]QXF34164.1 hypothetical protein B0X70_14175 [Photorhabdus akhurstii]UJD75985.1 hypothetical protein CE143_14170 [Photorhabdus luminescens]
MLNNKSKGNINNINKDDQFNYIDIAIYQNPININVINTMNNLFFISIKSHTSLYLIQENCLLASNKNYKNI